MSFPEQAVQNPVITIGNEECREKECCRLFPAWQRFSPSVNSASKYD